MALAASASGTRRRSAATKPHQRFSLILLLSSVRWLAEHPRRGPAPKSAARALETPLPRAAGPPAPPNIRRGIPALPAFQDASAPASRRHQSHASAGSAPRAHSPPRSRTSHEISVRCARAPAPATSSSGKLVRCVAVIWKPLCPCFHVPVLANPRQLPPSSDVPHPQLSTCAQHVILNCCFFAGKRVQRYSWLIFLTRTYLATMLSR